MNWPPTGGATWLRSFGFYNYREIVEREEGYIEREEIENRENIQRDNIQRERRENRENVQRERGDIVDIVKVKSDV